MMQKDLYKRLARVEAMANAQKAELMETLWRMYETACREQDAQQAAALVRKSETGSLTTQTKKCRLTGSDWTHPRRQRLSRLSSVFLTVTGRSTGRR